LFRNLAWGKSGRNIQTAHMTDLLQVMINEGIIVNAQRHCGGWIEFDTSEDYEKAVEWITEEKTFEIFKNILL
jgi:NDP-sugar pyrophosphorylase family protein